MGGGGLNVAYLRTADFEGGLKSGLIWLTFGGFLDFYSGNTAQPSYFSPSAFGPFGGIHLVQWIVRKVP